MLQSTSGLAEFVKAVVVFLGRSSGTAASASKPAFDAFAKALTESLADIPGDCLSSKFFVPLIKLLLIRTGRSTALTFVPAIFVDPIIETLKSANSFAQPAKPGVAAARLVTSFNSERLQRGDRERLMETVYTVARSKTSADFDGLAWESLLGLMVQLMAKPTFYAVSIHSILGLMA